MSDFPERMTTRTADGTELSVGVVRPSGKPRGVVLAGHAMMADARTLDRPVGSGLASTLASRGLLVVCADFRGHGASGTPAARGGRWSYDDLVHRDFPALYNLARSLAPGVDCSVLGHSLMGHVAAAYLGCHPDTPVSRLVTVASNLWMMNRETDLTRLARKTFDIGLIELFTRLFGRFPAELLRLGRCDESAGYMRQLCDTYWESRWRSVDGRTDYGANLARLRLPVLAVMGRGETYWCTPESLRAFYAPVVPAQLTLWCVGQGDHGLTYDPGHMDIVTDQRSEPLWQAFADWLLDRPAQGAAC